MNNILVAYDFDRQSEAALKQAVNLARITGCKITLLYVHDTAGLLTGIFSDFNDEAKLEKVNDQLDVVAARVSLHDGIPVEASLQKGRVSSTINRVAREIRASFIIMGTRSSDNTDPVGKRMMGTNTSRVIRSATCPVITINGSEYYNGCRSILLPMDLTKVTTQKVGWAIDIAKLYGANIRAVSALWSVNDSKIVGKLSKLMKEVRVEIEKAGVQCDTEIIKTPEGEKTHVPAILEYARAKGDIDLIVIMTQQEFSIIEFFIGSNAQEFIRSSEIPIVSIVPNENGFKSMLS